MKGFSQVILAGNVTKVPVVKDGYAKFMVAVETSYKNANGFQKVTNFVPVVAFGYATDAAAKLKTGDYVIVQGSMRSKIVDNKMLINVSAVKIIKLNLMKNSDGAYQNYNSDSNYNRRYSNNQGSNSGNNQSNSYGNNYGNKYNSNQNAPAPQPQNKQPDIPYDNYDNFDDEIPF